MNIQIIDFIFIGLILITTIVGLIRGFVASFFGKASFIVGVLAGVFFAKSAEQIVLKYINVPYLSLIIAFLCVFICVYFIMRLIQLVIDKLFSGEIMNGLDKSLGVFWGIVEGFLLVGVIITILYVQPFFDVTTLLSNSFFANSIFPVFINPESLKQSVNLTFSTIIESRLV